MFKEFVYFNFGIDEYNLIKIKNFFSRLIQNDDRIIIIGQGEPQYEIFDEKEKINRSLRHKVIQREKIKNTTVCYFIYEEFDIHELIVYCSLFSITTILNVKHGVSIQDVFDQIGSKFKMTTEYSKHINFGVQLNNDQLITSVYARENIVDLITYLENLLVSENSNLMEVKNYSIPWSDNKEDKKNKKIIDSRFKKIKSYISLWLN